MKNASIKIGGIILFLWNRKTIIITLLIIVGIFSLPKILVQPENNSELNTDGLANYLYSAPVIVKRIKAFFSFSELPIFEAKFKHKALSADNSKTNLKPRANLLPSPTATPVAAKTKVKAGNKTNTAGENSSPNWRPHFEAKVYSDNKNADDLSKDSSDTTNPATSTPVPNHTNANEQNINDWKYRLFMDPSKDNMNKFIQEYSSGKITKDVFYGVLKSLINESDDRSQAISLYALSAVPNIQSYELLALKIDENSLEKNNQTLAQKNIDYYSDTQHTNILLTALKSSSDIITLQALHNINQMIDKKRINNVQTQNVASLSEREKRGLRSTKIKKTSYLELVSALQGLTHETNSQIAILAENTLEQFKDVLTPQPSYEASNTQASSRYR